MATARQDFRLRALLPELVRLMRPHQWVKSGFVFVGLLFARAWNDPQLVLQVIAAAVAFSLVASGIYVVNDYMDRESDRLHPTKRHRPLAAGTVPPSMAVVLMAASLLGGLALGLWASPLVLALLGAYLLINLGYSFGLKQVVILDVFLLSSGFVLRILVGTVGVGIAPSQWLLFTGTVVALFLGFAKRRAEMIRLVETSSDHRRVLQDYSAVILDKAIGISATCIIMAYGLYTMSPETLRVHGSNDLVYTVPFVMYGVFRYLYLLHRSSGGGDPSRDVVRDPHLVVTLAAWFLVTFWILA